MAFKQIAGTVMVGRGIFAKVDPTHGLVICVDLTEGVATPSMSSGKMMVQATVGTSVAIAGLVLEGQQGKLGINVMYPNVNFDKAAHDAAKAAAK